MPIVQEQTPFGKLSTPRQHREFHEPTPLVSLSGDVQFQGDRRFSRLL